MRPLIGKRKPKYEILKNLARGSPLRKNKFIRKTKSQIQTRLKQKTMITIAMTSVDVSENVYV